MSILCRFCQRPWTPPRGVVASESFEADGKVSVVRDKWLLRVAPEVVLPTDVVRPPKPLDPIKCRCGELRQAHAKGWRFGTCEDGEPHWQCPECVRRGREPEPR